MTRLALEMARTLHQASLAVGHSLPVVRLLIDVCLRCASGWGTPHKAVIDTGATISLIPQTVWRSAELGVVASVRAAGVVSRPECTIPATLATVDCTLMDRAGRIGPLTIHALLAESDRVPLLLGMSGLLDRLRLFVDIPNCAAYLETE